MVQTRRAAWQQHHSVSLSKPTQYVHRDQRRAPKRNGEATTTGLQGKYVHPRRLIVLQSVADLADSVSKSKKRRHTYDYSRQRESDGSFPCTCNSSMEDWCTCLCCRWPRGRGLECRTHRTGYSFTHSQLCFSSTSPVCLAGSQCKFCRTHRQFSAQMDIFCNGRSFEARMKEYEYLPTPVVVHGSYLTNLGNPDE